MFDGHVNADISVSSNGKTLYFTHASATRPIELFSMRADGTNLNQVTHLNDDLFAQLEIPAPESVWYEGDGGTKIQAWIFKPAGFDPGRKYPLVYMVHGGPQSSWLDSWSFRWNPARTGYRSHDHK